MKGGYVYIMTNKPNGTLYIGVTANIAARVTQHRQDNGSDFCREYGLTRLVYVERHDRIDDAIAPGEGDESLAAQLEAQPDWARQSGLG